MSLGTGRRRPRRWRSGFFPSLLLRIPQLGRNRFAVAFRDAGASVFTACKVRVHVVSMQDFNGYFLFVVY